jgi:DNA-binding MarR family transcriptional regulator
MSRELRLDPYVTDVLMRDLVGHDRAPSAFLVYLWLWRMSRGEGRERVGASLQTIATQTGLSKSAVQAAVRRLRRRRLVSATRASATAAPVYQVLQPWRGN